MSSSVMPIALSMAMRLSNLVSINLIAISGSDSFGEGVGSMKCTPDSSASGMPSSFRLPGFIITSDSPGGGTFGALESLRPVSMSNGIGL